MWGRKLRYGVLIIFKKTMNNNLLKELYKKYKFQLITIYIFMGLVEILVLLQPFFLGKTIDGIINKNYSPLLVLIGIYVGYIVFLYKRMVYDTKIYTKIYNDIVIDFISKSNEDSSTKIARVDLASQVINLLENYAHYYLATIITMVGSISFVFSQNKTVGFIMVFCYIPVYFIVNIFYKKISQSTSVMNNHSEERVSTIINSDIDDIKNFFYRSRKLIIFSSTLSGKNWFWINILKYSFIIISILVYINSTTTKTSGEIIYVYSYINNFIMTLSSIPIGAEMYSRMSDVLKRLK
jgi:ABC-type multidrug transport system fused ATPase/permease subunit